MPSFSIASLFDHLLDSLIPARVDNTLGIDDPVRAPSLADMAAMAGVPEAGSGAWYLLVDLLDRERGAEDDPAPR